MADEFISLDKALKELRLKEDELKRLVSEGEIRAFRDADKMKFRLQDVEKLKQDTGRTIQFQDDSSDTLTDDLLFDEEVEDLDLDDEIGMATAPISSDETFIDDQPAAAAPSKRAKVGAKGKGGGRSTSKKNSRVDAGPAERKSTSTTTIRRTTNRSSRIMAQAEASKSEIHPVLVGVLVLTTLIMGFACLFWWDIANDNMSSATEGFASKVNEMFVK